VNGVKASEHARIEGGGGVEQLFVDRHDVESPQQPSGPVERCSSVMADGPEDLDVRQEAGCAIGLVAQIAAQRRRLRFCDDKLDQCRGIEIDHRRLSFSSSRPRENRAGARAARRRLERWAQIEQVASRGQDSATSDQPLEPTGATQRDEHGNRASASRDLQGLTSLDAAHVFARALPQFPNPDGFQGATL